jgi:tRNA (cmo5U34)-methyltransferase
MPLGLKPSKVRVGNLMLDRETREVWLSNNPLSLTYQEFEVLSLLLTQQNTVMSHVAICRAIWGSAGSQEVKRLGVVVSNLRKKLDRLSPYRIETARSRGYGIVLGDSHGMTTADPIGMHDWHSHAYAHDWIERQAASAKERERAFYLRKVTHLLPFSPEDEIRVLDIGAGYGALTKVILDAYPHSIVVVHDYAEPMLLEARSYLSGASDSVSFVRGDLLDDDWTKDIAGEFDAIVSSIAIHNVRYPERIRRVYRDVFDMLVPGGCFLNLDYVTPSGDFALRARRHEKLMDERYRIRHETGRWESLERIEAGANSGAVQAPADAECVPASVENHLRWLQEAGFREAECFWHDGLRALVGGLKP